MRRPALRLLITLGMLAAMTQDASAWTTVMESRVAYEATRLMPSSLRGILEAHAEDLNAGLREAATDEASPWHRQDPGQEAPSAAAKVEELASGIVSMIDGHSPFAGIARKMGALAHFIGDLNNPLQVSRNDPREAEYAEDYAEYVESNLGRFPLVFYGWKEASLDNAGPCGPRRFSKQVSSRARRYSQHISKAYAADNPEALERRFDVRSLPFGIGSLSYSHSVTDTARIWLHVWRRAHGDIRGTPYLARELAQSSPAKSANP